MNNFLKTLVAVCISVLFMATAIKTTEKCKDMSVSIGMSNVYNAPAIVTDITKESHLRQAVNNIDVDIYVEYEISGGVYEGTTGKILWCTEGKGIPVPNVGDKINLVTDGKDFYKYESSIKIKDSKIYILFILEGVMGCLAAVAWMMVLKGKKYANVPLLLIPIILLYVVFVQLFMF